MNKLLLIGGGGHCRSVLDSILSLKKYDKIGIIDYGEYETLGIPVIGTDFDLPRLKENGWDDAFVTVGSIGDVELRHRLFKMIKDIRFNIPSIIDPTATIARNVEIGEGGFIGKRAIVNTGSRVGCCAIINTGVIIEHDCVIGDFAHVSPGSILCGNVVVGSHSHVGAGSVVRQQIEIGNASVIGAGSVVVKNIPSDVIAFGNPCKAVGS